jgi:hypothetical protein
VEKQIDADDEEDRLVLKNIHTIQRLIINEIVANLSEENSDLLEIAIVLHRPILKEKTKVIL